MNNFHYALSLLDTMFNISLQEDEFEEIAVVGWGLIGNKRTKIYRYRTCVSDCSEGVELPCNVDEIEAVTVDFEDWNYSTNDTPNGDLNSAFVEQYIENRKAFKSPLYIKGKFIKYERVGNMLYFDHPHGNINILYRGVVVDDDGLPQITDKEALALATYCAYVVKFREGLKSNNANIIVMSDRLYNQWLTRADQARTGFYLSQNEWDEVLDAKTNWNRKIHGKSLKLYQ